MNTQNGLVEILKDLTGIQVELAATQNLSLEELVDLGMTLWKILAVVNKLNEPIRTRLRVEAKEILEGDPGRVYFDGAHEVDKCLVVVQSKRPRTKKGADIDKAKLILGELFDDLFRTSFAPVKDFLERAGKADPKTMTALHELVTIKADQPRVSFNPKKRSTK